MHQGIGRVVVAGLLACAGGAHARPTTPPPAAASAPASQAVPRPRPALVEQGSYVNRDGARVHVPAHTVDGGVPPGASAQCRDGTWSFSAHRRGTCSHHGGVARRL